MPGEKEDDAKQVQELARLKRLRSAKQGLLTRQVNHFQAHQAELNLASLQHLLNTIDEIHQKFEEAEEQIIMIDPAYDDVPPEEEFPISSAAKKFGDDYSGLRIQVLALIDSITRQAEKKKEDATPSKCRLPKLELPHFDGKLTNWIDFVHEFDSVTKGAGLTNVDKFRLLKSALGEGPREVISSIEITEANYMVAWEALKKRYNNIGLIFRSHINSILSLQGASGGNICNYRTLLDKSQAHYRAMRQMGTFENVADNMMIAALLGKLDAKCQREWEDYTDDEISSWEEFTHFLEKYTSTLEKVDQTRQQQIQLSAKSHQGGKKQTNLAANTTQKCFSCQSTTHRLKDCPVFLKLNIQERINMVKKLKVCLKCLTPNHQFKNCRVTCNHCKKPHNTLLHLEAVKSPTEVSSSTQTLFSAQGTIEHIADDNALLASIMINVYDQEGQAFPVHAILDSGSTGNICSDRLATLVGAPRYNSKTEIGGIGATSTSSNKRCLIRLSSNYTGKIFEIHASVLKKVTENYPSHPFDISDWEIPSDIILADPNFNQPQRIDLLIGGSMFWSVLKPQRLVLGPGLPFIQETEFGWIAAGPMPSNSTLQNSFNMVHQPSDDNESLKHLVQRFWEVDASESQNCNISPSDEFCQKFYEQTTTRDNTGRYIVRLPFKNDNVELGDSYEIAKRRFFNLERRLENLPDVKKMYSDFIDEYLELGHLEIVNGFDFTTPHYFLPHHCVIKPTSSTTKLRVVFDASCKSSNGLSLNDILHPGPKIQDDLFTILLRFRLPKYVVTADIQKMYRQIRINPPDANFQLILWRKFKSDALQVLRLRTVTYGTAPGAFLSIRTLHQLATDEGHKYPTAAKILKENFYVDDALFGFDSIDTLNNSIAELVQVLGLGGFKLSKFCSNSSEVLDQFPPELREKFLKIGDHDIIKTLGLVWQPNEDVFRYYFESEVPEIVTMRTVLSQIAKLFDPLGFICPVVTKAKIFYQHLWSLKLDWDVPLPLELTHDWLNYRNQFNDLKLISIERLAIPSKNAIELHGFSDASEKAYGACVYIRCKNSDGSFSTRLFCAKSRVAPTKTLTIARLELCAAKLLCDLMSRIKNEVFREINVANEFYWTDSSIVLDWLSHSPHKWKVFVGHRVSKILSFTTRDQWHHIPGNLNPADYISRGMTPKQISNCKLWWEGPPFLIDSNAEWPKKFVPSEVVTDLEEARNNKFVLTSNPVNDLTSGMHFSVKFRGTRRAFAYVLRFVRKCRERVRLKLQEKLKIIQPDYSKISIPKISDELEAETAFLISIQKASFPKEYKALENAKCLPKDSKLITLAPYLKDGIMRVGGRIHKSKLQFDAKHQILLPKDHNYTNSLVSYFHSYRVAHFGPSSTLAAVRSRYWPVGGLQLVGKICRQCIQCFKLRPKTASQYMGSLPFDRLNDDHQRPFCITGVDFAGPIIVRHHMRCKVEKKVYLALFICFVTKAVHVEVVPDLSSDAFIRALERFVADRGGVSKIFSDNAKNFVGTCNFFKELKNVLMADRTKIEEACNNMHIEWSFIPPRSPHHGGLWEASVKLLKRIIRNIVGDKNLTEDELLTVAKRASSIINSRPITAMSADPNDTEPLTPGHFLFGRPPAALPEVPIELPINHVKLALRMKLVNQQLWNRFRTEYFHLLQPRTKWLIKNDQFTVGSLVLIQEDNVDSLKWPVGRIVEVSRGSDGLVRVVKVRTSTGEYKRSVARIAVLPSNESSC